MAGRRGAGDVAASARRRRAAGVVPPSQPTSSRSDPTARTRAAAPLTGPAASFAAPPRSQKHAPTCLRPACRAGRSRRRARPRLRLRRRLPRRGLDRGHHPVALGRGRRRDLHADILRPKGATDADKTPVILSIGPYFNHSGQVGAAGPAQDASYDPSAPTTARRERFQDFIEGSGLLKKGYTFVMVDLRGFGGSDGCLDWSGPGEQADVVNAVKWAATQTWSNGKVGMYGKSYDGLTGLIGVNHRPPGLAAVVSQEPVYDDYRYLYGDGIRRSNSLATPALYDGIAASPGPLSDDPNYNAAEPQRPGLPRPELGRPGGRRRPRLGLLEAAQPDPRRRGLRRAALPHPGPDREQHGPRRDAGVPGQPHRLRAGVAGPVGPRARQRARRGRQA